VLQSVDLGDLFGRGWLPRGGQTCTGAFAAAWPQPGSGGTGDVTVELWSGSAKVIVPGSDTIGSTCVSLGSKGLAESFYLGHLVVVAGPGVVTVEVHSGSTLVGQRKVAPTEGSLFQVADLGALPGNQTTYEVVARDVSGHVVDRDEFSLVGH
jgi:hypothetical protein